MPLPQSILGADEEVVVEVHPHWSYFARPLLVTLAVAAAVIAVDVATAPLKRWAVIVSVAVIAVPGARLMAEVLRWRQTTTVLTSERLLFRAGVVRRDLQQVRLHRIVEIEVQQSLGDRLLGRGAVQLEVLDGDPLRLELVRQPRSFERVVTYEVELCTRGGPAPAPDPVPRPRATQAYDDLEGVLEDPVPPPSAKDLPMVSATQPRLYDEEEPEPPPLLGDEPERTFTTQRLPLEHTPPMGQPAVGGTPGDRQD